MSQLICSKKIHFYFVFYTFYSENVKKSQKVVFCQIFRSTWFRSLCSDQITRSDHWLEKSDLDQIKSDLDHWSDLKKIRSTILWQLLSLSHFQCIFHRDRPTTDNVNVNKHRKEDKNLKIKNSDAFLARTGVFCCVWKWNVINI